MCITELRDKARGQSCLGPSEELYRIHLELYTIDKLHM